MSGSTHHNRPGLPALRYRLGSHQDFLARMLEALPNQVVRAEEGEPPRRPLQQLSARTPDDPAVALLDAWAAVADVLCFYQERIANEGFLRTAIERRSVLELARAIGYELNPGVASSAYVAFQVEDAPGAPGAAAIPERTRLLSIPGQDERPQPFETSEAIDARAAWNALRPRLTRAQDLGRDARELRLRGLATGLRPGDLLLLVGEEREASPGSERWDLRVLSSVELDRSTGTTRVTWEVGLGHAAPDVLPAAKPRAYAFRLQARLFGHAAADWDTLPDDAKRAAIPGYSAEVLAVALTSDGRRAVSAGADHTLRCWAVDSLEELSACTAHQAPVRAVAVRSDAQGGEREALSGSADGELILWRLRDGAVIRRVAGHAGAVNGVACAPDGAWAASVGDDGMLRVWDLGSGALRSEREAHRGGAGAVALWDGHIVTGGKNGAIKIWDQAGGVRIIGGRHGAAITSLAVAGDRLASGSLDKTVGIWSLGRGARVASLVGHALGVLGVALGAGGTRVYSASADGTLRAWQEPSEDEGWLYATYVGHAGPVHAVAIARPAEGAPTLVSAGADGAAMLWDALVAIDEKLGNTSRELVSFIGHRRVIGHREWPDFKIRDVAGRRIDLDAAHPGILPGSWIALVKPSYAELYRVEEERTALRSDYRLSGAVTRLTLDTREHLHYFDLRSTAVFARSEALELPEVQDTEPVAGASVELAAYVPGLSPGRLLLVMGKRTRARATQALALTPAGGAPPVGIAEGEQVIVLEAARLAEDGREAWRVRERSGVEGILLCLPGSLLAEPAAPGDEEVAEPAILERVSEIDGRAVLHLRGPLLRAYDRATVTLCANAARVTHGETVEEVLGSGSGAAANQRFILSRTPLTYTPAPTATGGESSLEVRVGAVKWSEAPSLYGAAAERQVYTVRLDHAGRAHVIFGDGRSGARLPSGVENVRARYRVGVGLEGEVAAGAIALMPERPLGVRGVRNPVPAAGAAPPEPVAEARRNAPLTVLTFDRLVSLQDYEDFSRAFAGVGAAQAARLWIGSRRVVHVTIAGVEGRVIGRDTDLYRNLVRAIRERCDPAQDLRVDGHEPIQFEVAASVLVDPRHRADLVLGRARAALAEAFSFQRRRLAQGVSAAEVVTAVQRVEGVIAVDLDAMRTPAGAAGDVDLASWIEARPARWEGGVIRPAELLLINPGKITIVQGRTS